jgi:hypothetical protein
MTKEIPSKKTYTFFMPQEERIFLRHFHAVAIAIFLIVVFLRIFVSKTTAEDAIMFAILAVLPMYLLRLIYGKRFADSVTLDFDTGTVRFSFSDERGSFERKFQDIEKISFRFYITFVSGDDRIMVKRPPNKKEVFLLLRNVSNIDQGMFAGF